MRSLIMLPFGKCDQVFPAYPAPYHFFMCNSFAYCYHSVNVTTLARSQSDHIKRLPLYNYSNFLTKRNCNCFKHFILLIALSHLSLSFFLYLCQSLSFFLYLCLSLSSCSISFFLYLCQSLSFFLYLCLSLSSCSISFFLYLCQSLKFLATQ